MEQANDDQYFMVYKELAKSNPNVQKIVTEPSQDTSTGYKYKEKIEAMMRFKQEEEHRKKINRRYIQDISSVKQLEGDRMQFNIVIKDPDLTKKVVASNNDQLTIHYMDRKKEQEDVNDFIEKWELDNEMAASLRNFVFMTAET